MNHPLLAVDSDGTRQCVARSSRLNATVRLFFEKRAQLSFFVFDNFSWRVFCSGDAVNRKQNNVTNRRRRMTCIELRPTRPTSPPPPPPVDRPKSTGKCKIFNTYSYFGWRHLNWEMIHIFAAFSITYRWHLQKGTTLSKTWYREKCKHVNFPKIMTFEKKKKILIFITWPWITRVGSLWFYSKQKLI